MSFYSEHPKFLVAVDCIIFGLIAGRVCVLLTRRRFEPEKGKWSVMGGFVSLDQSVDQSARRVLKQLTGLDTVYMEQVHTFGEIERDPGERVISVAYYALLCPGEYDPERLERHQAVWTPLDDLPVLGFDHPQMIKAALAVLRQKIVSTPLVFNLLPEYFTLLQLQQVYEKLLGQPMDKRNFRKRVAENPFIEKTALIDKSSRRGASMYRFNRDNYLKSNNLFKL